MREAVGGAPRWATAAAFGGVAVVLAAAKWLAPVHGGVMSEPLWEGTSTSRLHGVLWVVELGCWSIAVAASLVMIVRLRHDRAAVRPFHWATLAVALFLLVDDAGQLHKPVLPDWTGLPPIVFLAGYGGVVLVWIAAATTERRVVDVPTVLFTFACFLVWIVCKVLPPFGMQNSLQIAGKLGGSVGWALVAVSIALGVRRQPTPGR